MPMLERIRLSFGGAAFACSLTAVVMAAFGLRSEVATWCGGAAGFACAFAWLGIAFPKNPNKS